MKCFNTTKYFKQIILGNLFSAFRHVRLFVLFLQSSNRRLNWIVETIFQRRLLVSTSLTDTLNRQTISPSFSLSLSSLSQTFSLSLSSSLSFSIISFPLKFLHIFLSLFLYVEHTLYRKLNFSLSLTLTPWDSHSLTQRCLTKAQCSLLHSPHHHRLCAHLAALKLLLFRSFSFHAACSCFVRTSHTTHPLLHLSVIFLRQKVFKRGKRRERVRVYRR